MAVARLSTFLKSVARSRSEECFRLYLRLCVCWFRNNVIGLVIQILLLLLLLIYDIVVTDKLYSPEMVYVGLQKKFVHGKS